MMQGCKLPCMCKCTWSEAPAALVLRCVSISLVKNSARGPVQTEAAWSASIIHGRDSAAGTLRVNPGTLPPQFLLVSVTDRHAVSRTPCLCVFISRFKKKKKKSIKNKIWLKHSSDVAADSMDERSANKRQR